MNHWGGGPGGQAADDLKGKIYDRRLYARMLRYLRPYLWLVVISFIILMMATFTEVILPLIQRKAIDDYIISDRTLLIFEDQAELQDFQQKYKILKLKDFTANGQSYVILSTKEINKIDAPLVKEYRKAKRIVPTNIFLLTNNAQNKAILSKYLKQNFHPGIVENDIPGWFELSQEKILITKTQFNRLSMIDRINVRGTDTHNLMILALVFFGIVLFRLFASYFQAVMTASFSQRAMNDLRHDVFAHLQKMPTQFFDQNPVGRLVTRVTNDIRAIDEMLASGVITIVQDVIKVIAIVVLMLFLNWQLALVSFFILPFVILTINIYKNKSRVIYREVRKQLAALNATLAEHIAGQKIIQLFNQYFHKRDEFSNINQYYFDASVRHLRINAFFRPITHVSSQIAVALIIWYGGGQILRNVITIGLLMAFTQYISKLFEPINDFSEKFDVLQGALAGAERIFDLMDKDPEDYRESLVRNRKFEGEIEFRNVWLAYNDEEWVLKDISFKVKPGEKIALVGHTGSGKTSIVNLLLGMYPFQRGAIEIDGKALRHYALQDIRGNIGIVQQDVFIFSGNIKENIALNNSKLSDEDILRVAKYVNADKFIQKLPAKYDEPVMERGATLSTGQRQLIAFARVLAYDPSIFILDEATSNIDTETEILIQDALHKIMQNRTSIIIAHRLSTIQHVDRIIVLHKGEIVEEGSHFDLLEKKGLYYDLYRLQYT